MPDGRLSPGGPDFQLTGRVGAARISRVTVTPRSLVDRAALVTGATSGLGRATALRLAAAGAGVALLGRSAQDLAAVRDQVSAHGVQVLPMRADLADKSTLQGIVAEAADTFGRLDLVVNAAATDSPARAEDLPLADWERVLAVNLTAPFAIARAAMPYLRRAGGGLIVNVSSVAGRRGWANAAAYCATKFALTGLTQALAADGRSDNIRVCVLYPGAMNTAWGTFDEARRSGPRPAEPAHQQDALEPTTVADLITWMAAHPAHPVLNEVTITPLHEAGWP
jgi:NAD(P)-dependent dehydrogenase (short-subunit alcohol dehydrogenase family)